MDRIDTPEGAPAANECPPVAGTTEGASIAVGANAPAPYPPGAPAGKPSQRARKYARNTRARGSGGEVPQTAYRASTGRIWHFSGKRARVVVMLVNAADGITQWDTLPWHTRLGGTVHALRRGGLEISAQIEGQDRHARYRLHTPSSLIIRAENSGGGQ